MSTPPREEKKRISAGDFVTAVRGPYRRLFSFLKPYRKRFIIGLICGAIYGGLNGAMIFGVKNIFEEVLPKDEVAGRNRTTIAEAWHPRRELPELQSALSALALPGAQQEAAVQGYSAVREQLHDATLQPAAQIQTEALASLQIPESLPAEFRHCLEGERQLLLDNAASGSRLPVPGVYSEHLEKARGHWKQVLQLPEEQRLHRTLWARYLLAYTEQDKAENAAELTRLHKDAATGKFTDVLNLVDAAPRLSPLSKIILLCLIIPAMMITRAVFGFLNGYCMTWVSLRVLNDIRGNLFQRILGQSMEFFNKQKSGDLMQTIMTQTRTAREESLSQVAGDIIKEPISIIGALIALFYIDPKFTLMSFILFPLLIVPVSVVGKQVRRLAAAEEREAGNMSVIMQEALIGIREVKSYGREGYETERFRNSNWRMLSNMQRWRKMLEAVGPSVEVMASIGVAGALVYAWSLNMPAAKFIALHGGLVLLYPPAKSLSRIPVMLQRCTVSTTSVFDLMDREVSVKDAPGALPLAQPASGRICFDKVTFGYKEDSPALRAMSLDINPNETVAFVGRSGAGKATIFSLLLRLYDPQQGRILMDGHDIKSITQESLRGQIGVVSQDVFLFHDSIYENIRYGRLDATEAEIQAAAKRAHAHDFILEQPQGYQTIIGDKGSLLSGGQRQRISIARAFLKNAPILLLDEATSALDPEAERHIQEAIRDLAEGKTVLAIAHRLATVIKSDRIVVMQDGMITATGKHSELLTESELYRNLYSMQFHADGV